jgi:hypothetical protein
MGITVVEVPGLDVDIAYVAQHRIALVKACLGPSERQRAADWVFEEAMRDLASWTPDATS